MKETPLAKFLRSTGTTQTALAGEVGCKKSMINLIAKGKRRPSPELAARIQKSTGIDARLLLGIPMETAA